jgi:hypothetical protein
MTSGITAALIVAAALGATFRTTRHVGIAATAALVFMWPWLAALVVAALAVYLYRSTRRSHL